MMVSGESTRVGKGGKFYSPQSVSNDHHVFVRAERNLLAAILCRAIGDIYGDAQVSNPNMVSAKSWIYAKINIKEDFSFGWVAHHLDLDPYALQHMIRSLEYDPEKLEKCIARIR